MKTWKVGSALQLCGISETAVNVVQLLLILGLVETQRLPCYPPRYLHLGSGASLPEL